MAMGRTDSSDKPQIKPKKKEKDILPTKVVLRRLPPTLTEEKLKEILSAIPEYNYFRFVKPDYSLYPHVFSRAYINFKSFDHVLQFRNTFDGYIIDDGNGNEYSAVVELSAYQGLPKESKRRKDPKCGTIIKDPDYEAFLAALNKKVEPLPSAEVYLEAMEAKNEKDAVVKPQIPLVEFLNKKRASRNLNRQSNSSLSENERRLKREKENSKDLSKGSKSERKSIAKDGRKDRTEPIKITQDKKSYDTKRKDEARDRKSTSGRKSRNDRNIRDHKDQRRESRKDSDDRPLSARSDSSRSNENKSSKRDDAKEREDRKNRNDKRYTADGHAKRDDDQRKPIRANPINEEDERTRRKSIEYEDPSIVAFGKTFDSKKEGGNDVASKTNKNIERKDNFNADKERDKRTKNRDRPALAVYRPPVARQERSKGKDERVSPEKTRIKSPENSRTFEKKNRSSDRSFGKDRARSRQKEEDVGAEYEANRT